MDCSDSDLKNARNTEQLAVIGKIQSMQWLKKNSRLPKHAQTNANDKEIKNQLETEVKVLAEQSTEVLPTAQFSENPELETGSSSIPEVHINESNCKADKSVGSVLTNIGGLCQNSMETVWNKDNAGTELFPSTQSLVIQSLNEEEMMNMAIAESIVTAQLEQFRLDDDKKTTSASSHKKSDNDSRATAHCTLPNSQKSEKSSTVQVPGHDNNNNNAKSKNQSVPETKTFVQKPTVKTGVKKLVDQKVKRQAGSTSTESCTNLRECTKEKSETSNLSNKIDETTVIITKSSSLCPDEFIDKYGRVDGYNNKHLFMGKGGRMKEYEYLKKHGYLDNNANKKTSERTEEKSVGTKQQSRVESNKKYNGADSKKCHNVTVTRTQSFNPEYNRSKLLVKPQQRYSRVVTKSEPESSSKQCVSGFKANVCTPSSSSGRTSDNKSSTLNKESDTTPTQSTSGNVSKRNGSHSDVSRSVSNSAKHTNPVPYKPPLRTSTYSARLSTERNKENQPYSQGYKRDSNVFRRSVNPTEHRHANERAKTDDSKKNITNNNASREYKTNLSSSRITKPNSQPVSSTTTVSTSNINKTSRSSLSSGNNTQTVEPVDSSDSKDAVTCTKTSVANDQNPPISETAPKETEIPPITKSGSEENNNSNSKIDNKPNVNTTEVKSVKFSDNVQEIRVSDTSIVKSIPSISMQKNEGSTNPFFSELQTAPETNVQVSTNTRPSECTTYPNDMSSMKPYIPNQESHFLDILQHSASQNLYSSNIANSNVAAGNNTQYYPNTSGIHLNHHNDARAVSTKTTDTTNASHATLVPNTSSYNVQNSNYTQAELSTILLASTQTAVIPPPGFHNHPIISEQDQWNLLTPDTLYFGNAMTTGHPVNMHIPNSRVICNDFNNIQQTGYVQHPLPYAPVCMQNWHPLFQCAPSTIQNIQYTNCGTYPPHIIPSNNSAIPLNCPASSSAQNNLYKHHHQYEQMEYESLAKHERYMGNMQGSAIRSNSTKAQDRTGDFQLRSNHYHRPGNDYRSYPQDTQSMMHSSYPTSMDPVGRRNQWQSQVQQKYGQRGGINPGYQGVFEGPPKYQNTQDLGERRDNDPKIEPESIPPIISPRECMYYGINFQRKVENSNSNLRNVTNSTEYVHSTSLQEHGVPQFPRYPYKTVGRGVRTSMEPQN